MPSSNVPELPHPKPAKKEGVLKRWRRKRRTRKENKRRRAVSNDEYSALTAAPGAVNPALRRANTMPTSNIDRNTHRWDTHAAHAFEVTTQSQSSLQGERPGSNSESSSESSEDEEEWEPVRDLTEYGELEVTVYQIDFTPPNLPSRRKPRAGEAPSRKRSYLLRCSVSIENKSEPVNLHPNKGTPFPIKKTFKITDITGQMKLRIWAKGRRHDRCLGQVVVPITLVMDDDEPKLRWHQILPHPRLDREGEYEGSHPEVNGIGLERKYEKLGWVRLSVFFKPKYRIMTSYVTSPVFPPPMVPRDQRFLPARFAKNMDRITRYLQSNHFLIEWRRVQAWESPGYSIIAFFVWSYMALELQWHFWPLTGWLWMVFIGYWYVEEDPPLDPWEVQPPSAEIGDLGHMAEIYKVSPQLRLVDEWIEDVATFLERVRHSFDWNKDHRMSMIVLWLSFAGVMLLTALLWTISTLGCSLRSTIWFFGVVAMSPAWRRHSPEKRFLWKMLESIAVLRYLYFWGDNLYQRVGDVKTYEHLRILENSIQVEAPVIHEHKSTKYRKGSSSAQSPPRAR